VLEKALARRPEDRFSSAADFLEALSLAQAGGPVGTDATVIVARRLLQPGGSGGSNETLIVPRRPGQAGGAAGANETVLIPLRPTGAAGRGVADETLLVPRRSEPDNSDYTMIRPVSTGQSHPLTEPLPPPFPLEPEREVAAGRAPDGGPVPERDAGGDGHRTSQLLAADIPSQDPGWTRAELTQIEKHLARFVGPIAGVWVRSGARETGDLVALVQWLAAKFSEAADRDAFLTSFGVTSGSAPTRGHPDADIDARGTCADGGVPLTPEYIARAARLLAVHMGPIATVLAKRAAQPGSSREQFVDALVAHLNDDGERAKFLRTLGS
jgi:hypothetical protein